MSRTKIPHHLTSASLALQGIEGDQPANAIRYNCSCTYIGGVGFDLCQYHDGYNDACTEFVPEPDDEPSADRRPWTTILGHLEQAESLLSCDPVSPWASISAALATAHVALATFYTTHGDSPINEG